MPVLVALIGLAGVLAGVAVGWYLRSINAWCPQCGGAVSCTACGRRPSWTARPSDASRPPVRAEKADHHA